MILNAGKSHFVFLFVFLLYFKVYPGVNENKRKVTIGNQKKKKLPGNADISRRLLQLLEDMI